jgi:predicted DNA-binding transcriptional regulator AlpA
MQTAPEGKPATPAAQSFQPLPAEGEGLITMKALAAAMDVCEATVWDWAKTDPNFPTIIRRGQRFTRLKLSEARAYINQLQPGKSKGAPKPRAA